MKSFWMNLGVADLEKSAQFYEKLGFAVASFGDVRSVTLPEGGNLILMQTETFAQRVPFQLAEKGNEVLISQRWQQRRGGPAPRASGSKWRPHYRPTDRCLRLLWG